jgi:hypothetical protein
MSDGVRSAGHRRGLPRLGVALPCPRMKLFTISTPDDRSAEPGSSPLRTRSSTAPRSSRRHETERRGAAGPGRQGSRNRSGRGRSDGAVQGVLESAGATQDDLASTQPDLEAAEKDAKQAAADAGNETEKAQAEADQATAELKAAESRNAVVAECAKAYISAVGVLFDGEATSDEKDKVREQLSAITGTCKDELAAA